MPGLGTPPKKSPGSPSQTAAAAIPAATSTRDGDPALFVELLGPLRVTFGGEQVGLTGPSRCSLFVRLVLANGEAVSFETLTSELWAGRDRKSARRNLQQQIHNLRVLPGLDRIETVEGGAYRLVLAPSELDAVLADDGLHTARSLVEIDPDAALTQVREALHRFRGPPMAEFASHDWARDEAARLVELRDELRSLEVELRLAGGADATLISELRALTDRHPENERYWAALMTALYRDGHRDDALTTFQDARRRLNQQFDRAPGPGLQDLEHRILRDSPDLKVPAVPEANGPVRGCGCWVDSGTTPLIGRAAELERLNAAIDAGANLVVLSGEIGSGTTKVMTELVDTQRAPTVLFGTCDDSTRRPFPAINDAIEHAELHNPGLLNRLEARVSVEMLRHLLDPDTSVLTSGRNALVSALSALLAEAGSTHDGDVTPPLLIIDRADEADVDTLEVLGRLVDPLSPVPVTVVCITQPPGLAPTANLGKWLAALPHQSQPIEIELPPLDEQAIADLASALGSPNADQSDLLSRSGGNPMFVEHLLADRDGPGATTSLARLARRRIARRSPDAVAVLQAAAIDGLRPSGWLVAELSGLGHRRAATAITELIDDRLLVRLDPHTHGSDDRSDPAGVADRYWFAHGLMRNVMLAEIGPAVRHDMHRRAAELLVARQADGNMVRAGDIARHYLQAAPLVGRAPAIEWLRASARSAVRNSAYDRAEVELTTALSLVSEAAEDDVLAAELLTAKGRLLSTFEHEGDGRIHLEAAITRARSAGRLDLAAFAALHLGGVLPMGDLPDPATSAAVEEALTLLGEDEPHLRAELTGRLAELRYLELPIADRRALCDEAQRLCTDASPEVQVRVGINRFWACELDAGPFEIWRLIEKLEALVARVGDPWLALQVTKCRLHATLASGDLELADDVADRFATSSAEVGAAHMARLDRLYGAMRAGSRGDYERAGALADESKRLLASTGRQVHAELVDSLVRLPWHVLRGEPEEPRRFVKIVLGMATTGTEMWQLIGAWLGAISGDTDEAFRLVDELDLSALLDGEARQDRWVTAATATMLARVTGRTDWAAQLAEWFTDHADTSINLGQTVFLGFGWHYLGIAESMLEGDDHHDAAVEALLRASERSKRFGATPWKLVADLELARLGVDPEGGTDVAPEELAVQADRLGLALLAERARALR